MAKLSKELRTRLSQFLSGEMEVAAFQGWFAIALSTVHQSDDPEAEALFHAVAWEFFDRRRAVSTEEQMRQKLAALARETVLWGKPLVAGVAASPACEISSSGTSSVTPDLASGVLVFEGSQRTERERVSA